MLGMQDSREFALMAQLLAFKGHSLRDKIESKGEGFNLFTVVRDR